MRPLYLAFISLAVIQFDAAVAESERQRRQRKLRKTPTPTPTPRVAPAPTNATVASRGLGPADLTVGVFYYPWHTNNFHNGDKFLREQLIPPQLPALGKYNDQQEAVIRQHLQWCMNGNIFLWVMSWWGPSARNTVTTKIMLDYMERQTSTSSFPINKFKTAMFYETLEHVKQIGTTGRYNTSLVKGHIEFMADEYFKRPNCFKIDNKPVIFVYLTRVLYATTSHPNLLKEVIDLMKLGAKNKGYDIYIVGDHAYDSPNTLPVPYPPFNLLQAVTNYDVFGSMRRPLYADNAGVLAYRDKQQGWKNKANAQGCGFIPSITPGFNKAGQNPNLSYGPMSRRLKKDAKEGSLFEALLKNAVGLVDSKVNVIVVNSFNEYHEDTMIEPLGQGPKDTNKPSNITAGLTYKAYGTTYLDLVNLYT